MMSPTHNRGRSGTVGLRRGGVEKCCGGGSSKLVNLRSADELRSGEREEVCPTLRSRRTSSLSWPPSSGLATLRLPATFGGASSLRYKPDPLDHSLRRPHTPDARPREAHSSSACVRAMAGPRDDVRGGSPLVSVARLPILAVHDQRQRRAHRRDHPDHDLAHRRRDWHRPADGAPRGGSVPEPGRGRLDRVPRLAGSAAGARHRICELLGTFLVGNSLNRRPKRRRSLRQKRTSVLKKLLRAIFLAPLRSIKPCFCGVLA